MKDTVDVIIIFYAALKTFSMKAAGSLDWFLKRYELVCKKQLKHPIHIELR